MFFNTIIRNSIVLQNDSVGNIFILNTQEPVISSGFETNLKMDYRDLIKVFMGYTYTEARAEYLPGDQFLPLLPRHKINTAVFYELEKNLKIGLEAYFTGRQYLADGTRTPSFWELGAMVEKTFGKISIFLNAENFTDTRQSRYKGVVSGPHTDPVFDDIWTHTEGFILNGGVKVRILK
jgi:iron complex outermembrane receptor protein/outer membrane receptor for ferrienterochelin and colicins